MHSIFLHLDSVASSHSVVFLTVSMWCFLAELVAKGNQTGDRGGVFGLWGPLVLEFPGSGVVWGSED